MSLHLLHGPPNSGRAGHVRRRFAEALPREPILVVPTLDDVFAFERELARDGALLGGRVATFEALFGEAAAAAGIAGGPVLTPTQRLRLTREAAARTPLGVLRRSAATPGFAVALDELIGELQAAGASADSVAAAAGDLGESAYLSEMAALFAAFLDLREAAGMSDVHATAAATTAALERDPDLWRGRPVLLYGFDDMTGEQLELVAAMSRGAPVTVALTYEDRRALAARARLLEELRRRGATEEALPAQPDNTASPLLFALERGFLQKSAVPVAPDESLVFLRSAGRRAEAEAIGAEIARLLADGLDADVVAVALRSPESDGTLFARVFGSFGIPVALEAKVPVARTATGATLAALLRAVTEGSAEALMRYLRGPARAAPARVDSIERRRRRERLGDAAEVAALLAEREERAAGEFTRLRELRGDSAGLLDECARLVRDIAEWPLARQETRGLVPGPAAALEVRAGAAIAAALEELGALPGLQPGAADLPALLEDLQLPLWAGPATGRVRIASPYRLRAGRFHTLFAASLQDGEFPRHRDSGPFLTDEQRHSLGLPERAETEAEEAYLFYSCLSLPTHRLFLSYRGSDERGEAEARSPFLDDVRRLLAPPVPASGEDPVEAQITRARGLGDVVFEPSAAPGEDELARALAATASADLLGGMPVPAAVATRVLGRLERAREKTFLPEGIESTEFAAELAGRAAFGGTTLEAFATCSYRWFVDHELRPDRLEPKPEPLLLGGLMHKVLERLYTERPGGDPIPREGSLDRWVARAGELTSEEAGGFDFSTERSIDRALLRRAEALLAALLRREATSSPTALPTPETVEAGFGYEDEKPALDLGGFSLHGRIDRIDLSPRGAVVRDYKLGAATPYKKFDDEAKLQLALYMAAVRELWGVEPVGGLYVPLSSGRDTRPRGIVLEEAAAAELQGVGVYDNDAVGRDELEAVLAAAKAKATTVVARMREGDITRDPVGGTCPRYCTYAPICRRERGAIGEPEAIEGEEDSS
ncbi:MAG TPA: PD-(D/E)XK nuclease family protein [Solirubrobacterales bacterium]|nr:PD-(D/E)XK nuclease family protein [Solirubrobacterales bacterium]